jgi:hydrogenase maturation protease
MYAAFLQPMTIRILGLGNVLMGDDGLGPTVLHDLLSRYDLTDVEVHDLGTPGLDLVPFLSGADTVILVDTVRSEGAPGDRRRYEKAEILRHAPHPRVSPHDPGLKEALLALEFDGRAPGEVVLLGAIPEQTDMGTTLTPPLQAAARALVDDVLEELRRRGIAPRLRETPRTDRPWWT